MTVSRSASVDELGKPLRVVRDARRGDDDRVVVREEEERPATVIGDTLATTRPEPRRRAMFETLPALPATSADVVDPIVHAAPLMISPSIEDPLSLSLSIVGALDLVSLVSQRGTGLLDDGTNFCACDGRWKS